MVAFGFKNQNFISQKGRKRRKHPGEKQTELIMQRGEEESQKGKNQITDAGICQADNQKTDFVVKGKPVGFYVGVNKAHEYSPGSFSA